MTVVDESMIGNLQCSRLPEIRGTYGTGIRNMAWWIPGTEILTSAHRVPHGSTVLGKLLGEWSPPHHSTTIPRIYVEYKRKLSTLVQYWFSIGSMNIALRSPQNWALKRESHPEKNSALSGSSDVDRIPFKFRQRAAPHRSCKLVRSSRTILTRETWPQSGKEKNPLTWQSQGSKTKGRNWAP